MKALLSILVLLFLSSSLFSQNKFDFDYEQYSTAFEKERKFYVHVHEDYYLNEIDSFGVIYILDAQSNTFFNHAKSIIDYLVWNYQISPVIVVGIHSDNRHKEFIPLDRSIASDSPKNIGQAEKLREHIKNEIFPVVKKDFKVTEFKAVIGHSRAGSFIANTIFSDNKDLFNAYIAISPGMHYLNNQILDDAEKMISEKSDFNKFYYCTYGTVGSLEAYFKPQVNFLDSLFKAYTNNTIEWIKKEIPGKTHWGTVAPSIADGLLEMNRAYQLDQFLVEQFSKQEDKSIQEQVDAYYQNQQKKLKHTIPVTASSMRRYGNEFSEMNNHKRALELYDISIEMDKNNINTYQSKAWAFYEVQDYANAEKVMHEALRILEKNELQLENEELEISKSKILKSLEDMKKRN